MKQLDMSFDKMTDKMTIWKMIKGQNDQFTK